jgi:hypothetical protein
MMALPHSITILFYQWLCSFEFNHVFAFDAIQHKCKKSAKQETMTFGIGGWYIQLY